MKQWVGKNNMACVHQAFNEIDPDKWKKVCDHVKKTEMIYYEQREF